MDRLAEGMAVEHKGNSPGFVLDPAWPQPLPHHWVIGDVGGIAVDKHDHIWVYHRPRSVTSTAIAGCKAQQATDAKGNRSARSDSPGLTGGHQRLLHARAVRARVRQSREIAAVLGRSG